MIPRHAEAMRSMRAIWLDAGKADEFFLDNGMVAVSKELDALGVEHTLELFDGGHMSIGYRYPGSLAFLVRRARLADRVVHRRCGTMDRARARTEEDPMSDLMMPPAPAPAEPTTTRLGAGPGLVLGAIVAAMLVLVGRGGVRGYPGRRGRGGTARARVHGGRDAPLPHRRRRWT